MMAVNALELKLFYGAFRLSAASLFRLTTVPNQNYAVLNRANFQHDHPEK
jgi:hypothetical protein